MDRYVLLSTSTILAAVVSPGFYQRVPAFSSLLPQMQAFQGRLVAIHSEKVAGCAACAHKKATVATYSDMVRVFAARFMELYVNDRPALYPMLDYFRADRIELPTKQEPRVILARA